MRDTAVTHRRPGVLAVLCATVVLWSLLAPAPLAQVPKPDPREMSGIPRPVSDLPDRVISVRLIRGDLSNNIVNHPVELLVDGRAERVSTDESGRAQFGPIAAGATVKAVAVVDGERLESQEFSSPSAGGIRLMLVATDREREARAAREAAAPPVTGNVVLGGETRIVIEADDEAVRVFYLLDIVNTARAPVNLLTPFAFDAPTGALGTTVMEGSSPQASATGTRVRVQGPFPPGTTAVQVGFLMPAPRGTVDITQRFPAALQQLGVIVERVGDAQLASPQIDRQQPMPIGERTYIAAAGGSIPAGEPLLLTVTGLPHHSAMPRLVALALAGIVVLAGGWTLRRSGAPPVEGPDAKRLESRRERLFQDLVRLETDRRHGRVDESRYASRREELVAALEHIYGAVDTGDIGPAPAGEPGLA
jgi:hypothetical protein